MSGPEDNPEDDHQPTKEEWDKAMAADDKKKLKSLIVQMNDANNGLCGMALLARDPSNLTKYSEKFMAAYHAALDLLDRP